MRNLEVNHIYHMDCLEGMSLLDNESIDLVITDPPFAIDFKARRSNYNRTQSRVLEGYNEVHKSQYYDFTVRWMREVYRLLRASGSMYVFSGWNNLKDILVALDEIGFITVNHIIWKYQFGVVTKRKFVTSHYHCLYVCKNDERRKFFPYARFGKESQNSLGRSLHYEDKEDVWVIKREYWHGDQKTPTKLPAELVRKILQYSSQEGDIVLDPFLGSGQVAIVAKMMRRRYIGFEIVKKYYEFAKERLERSIYRIKDSYGPAEAAETIDLFDGESMRRTQGIP
jgi:site-specific DNA-methyltransferase (adenine-specific)